MKPNPPEPEKDEVTTRFRTILSAGKEVDPIPAPKPSWRNRSQRSGQESARKSMASRSQGESASESTPRRFGPAFWTLTGILSLLVNSILIALTFVLLGQMATMRKTLSAVSDLKTLPLNTVSGLYRNFEAMEAAHIRTQIPVETNVPVTLTVCLKTGTNVVINQDVTIPNARVTVQTGGLNISNALTTIVLPGNTGLPINLDLCVPVESVILVRLNVDVDIPLADTDLNLPFTGLQESIAPLYCLLDKDALTAQGTLVCDEVPASAQ